MLTYEDVKNNSAVRTYIQRADESLTALGYTEHSFAHVTAVAENAAYILSTLGYPERTVELAKIAGFLHDIGNLVNRVDHSQSGAVMAFRILDKLGAEAEEISQQGSFTVWRRQDFRWCVWNRNSQVLFADRCVSAKQFMMVRRLWTA